MEKITNTTGTFKENTTEKNIKDFCEVNPQGNGIHIWDRVLSTSLDKFVCRLCGRKI